MRWENGRQYSPQEINLMQKDALDRVRQMQHRSEQMLHRTRQAPSFFVEEKEPRTNGFEQEHHHSADNHSAKQATSFAETPFTQHKEQKLSLDQAKDTVDRLLYALNLDHDRLLILAVLFLLYTDGADKELLLALAYIFL